MNKTDKPGRAKSTDDDAGLEEKFQEYHDHGGPQGDVRAKDLEGDIGTVQAEQSDRLNKARPDSSTTNPPTTGK